MKQTLLLLIVAIMGCNEKKEDAPVWTIANTPIYMKEINPHRDTVEAIVLTMNVKKQIYWRHVYMARYYHDGRYTLDNVLNLKKKPINIQVFETHYKQR